MIRNKFFTVADGETFDRTRYPEVTEELNRILSALSGFPGEKNSDIIISYYKDRRIKTEFLTTHRPVTEIVLSGSLSTYYIEEMFASCRNNSSFRTDFEQFIHEVLNTRYEQSPTKEDVAVQVARPEVQFTLLHGEDYRFDHGKKGAGAGPSERSRGIE